MPDLGPPPASLDFAELVQRLRGQPASYAQTRLGRQPVIYAGDEGQYEGLTNPLHDPHKTTYGATFMDPSKLGWASMQSPLYGATQEALKTGEPVSVIAPYEKPVSGPGGTSGTEPGVPLHEATHQFTKGLPLQQIVGKLSGSLQTKMSQALAKSGYSDNDVPGEVTSRLIAGQFGSLGLDREEGLQARGELLANMQKVAPKQAQRLGMYTRGRTPLTYLDAQGVSRTEESRDPATGIQLPK
jgi:hypothetical protein